MYRVSTMATQNFIMERINDITSQYATDQVQVSTGQKGQSYADIAPQAQQQISLANSSSALDQFKSNTDTANARLTAISDNLNNIVSIATKMQAQIVQALNPGNAQAGDIQEEAAGYMQQVVGLLNGTLAGVQLFGGTMTNTPPVPNPGDPYDASNPPNAAVVTQMQSMTYYQGSNDPLTVQISATVNVSYGINANRSGFQNLLASLQNVVMSGGSTTQLQTALTQMNSAVSDLTQAQADVGHQMDVVNQAASTNSAVQLSVKSQLSDIDNVDVSSAMSDLSQQQTLLQAAYSVVARMQSMSLASYLK